MAVILLDIQRQPDLTCLDGTPLEGVTLDQLLQNVHDNECYREKAEIAEEVDEVRRIYFGYVVARSSSMSGIKPNHIAQEYNLPLPTVITWTNGTFPTKLKGYVQSLLPKTQAQKCAFAYVLGVVSSHAPSGVVQETIFREHESAEVRKTLVDAVVEAIDYLPVVKRNRVCINHAGFSRLVRGLQGRSLRDYITSPDEAKAFLKGFLDFSNIEPHLKVTRKTGKTTMIYTITSSSHIIYEALVWSLFKLRMYPLFTKDRTKLEINGRVDLRLLAESRVVSESAKTTLDVYLSQQRKVRDPLQWYYEVRKNAEAKKQHSGALNVADVLRAFPTLRETTVRKWVADIAGYGEINVPFRVRRYEAVCAYLEINHYTTAVRDQYQAQTSQKNRLTKYRKETWYKVPYEEVLRLKLMDRPDFQEHCIEDYLIIFDRRSNNGRPNGRPSILRLRSRYFIAESVYKKFFGYGRERIFHDIADFDREVKQLLEKRLKLE